MCIHVPIGDEFQISQWEHDFISGTWICPPLVAFPIFNLDASSSVIYNLYEDHGVSILMMNGMAAVTRVDLLCALFCDNVVDKMLNYNSIRYMWLIVTRYQHADNNISDYLFEINLCSCNVTLCIMTSQGSMPARNAGLSSHRPGKFR
jgi:hypothetical protein